MGGHDTKLREASGVWKSGVPQLIILFMDLIKLELEFKVIEDYL